MAVNNIKLFDENKTNMLTDEQYVANQQRLDGVQTGIASSMLHNKSAYQASLVSNAIGEIMVANGYDATDTGTVTSFVANLKASVLQKVVDMATSSQAISGLVIDKWMSPAKVNEFYQHKKATTAEAQAGTVTINWMSPKTTTDFYDFRKATAIEARQGILATKWMSPLTTLNAITYNIATTDQAKQGQSTTKLMSPNGTNEYFFYKRAEESDAQKGVMNVAWMSPKTTTDFYDFRKATTDEAWAGTNNTKWMSPSRVSGFYFYRKALPSEIIQGTDSNNWISPDALKKANIYGPPKLLYKALDKMTVRELVSPDVKRILVAMIGGGGMGKSPVNSSHVVSAGGGSGQGKVFIVDVSSGGDLEFLSGAGSSQNYTAGFSSFIFRPTNLPSINVIADGGGNAYSESDDYAPGAIGGQCSYGSADASYYSPYPVFGGIPLVSTHAQTLSANLTAPRSPNIFSILAFYGIMPFCCAAGSYSYTYTVSNTLPNGNFSSIACEKAGGGKPTDPGAGSASSLTLREIIADGADGGVFIYDWTGREGIEINPEEPAVDPMG